MGDPESIVVADVEATVVDCRSAIASMSEGRLFSMTVRLAICLMSINILLSSISDQQHAILYMELFTALSGLFVYFEERLEFVHRGERSLLSIGRGRPRIQVDFLQVESLLELNLSLSEIADIIGVSRVTLWRRLTEVNLCVSRFTDIDDSTLDDVISSITHNFPNIGISMLTGHLNASDIYVSRRRIRNSLVRLSPLSVLLRSLTTVSRRRYTVPAPNSLWHIDGHHSLIRWRMVIHGGIDGFSRLVVYMRCCTNNWASTVLELFMDAVQQYGWPSRVRSDQGMENIEVARAILHRRGVGRRSHIAGSSVHNQRIERLWRDTFNSVIHLYYGIFYDLEDSGFLDPMKEEDLFCLHYIFVPRINHHLQQFVQCWNRHPLRTEGNRSPTLLWREGMQTVILNPLDSDHPAVLDGLTSFGVDIFGPPPNPFDSGSVVVPEVNINLTLAQVQTIQSQFNPLLPSDSYGVDHYIGLRFVIQQLL